MKKVLRVIVLIALIFLVYKLYIEYKNEKYLKEILNNASGEFKVNDYYIFGNHFNIFGCINEDISLNSKLVLKNINDEILLDSTFYKDNNKTCFYTSKEYNDGIYLDNLKKGKYLLLVNDNDNYYSLINDTKYSSSEYYTITNNHKNNKIDISFKKHNDNNYFRVNIIKTRLPHNVYDITIDPGHGGKDTGAIGILNGKEYYESNLTLDISLLLKKELESKGLKVGLTRSDDSNVNPYDENGRAIIPNDNNSKYSISIHLNSYEGTMNYGGVEVYTPNNINYDLAKSFADNISKIVGYSKKKADKLYDGVYYEYFTKDNIIEYKESQTEKDLKPYDVTVGAPYMFMIREVGGINTYAYIDGRNKSQGYNKYYNSNKVAEPYLIELAYINYKDDLYKLINKKNEFSNAISKALLDYLNVNND